MATKDEILREAATFPNTVEGLTTLVEKHQGAIRQCKEWTGRVAAEEEDTFLWVFGGDADPESVADRDEWCIRRDVYGEEIIRRKAAGGAVSAELDKQEAATAEYFAEGDKKRAEMLKSREKEREDSDKGWVEGTQDAVLGFVGLGEGMELGSRALGIARLALILGTIAGTVWVGKELIGGAVGVAERSAGRVLEAGGDVIQTVIPG